MTDRELERRMARDRLHVEVVLRPDLATALLLTAAELLAQWNDEDPYQAAVTADVAAWLRDLKELTDHG